MNKAKVVLTTVIGTGVLLLGLFLMARGSSGTANAIEAHFDDVIGLNNNSSVLHRGVRVGEVTAIEPLDASGAQAKLTIVLDESADIEVHSDAVLVLRLKTLLGELFLDLDPGTSGEPLEDPVTETHRDTSIDTILFQGAALYQDVQSAEETKLIIDQVRAVARDSGDDIQAITANTRTVMDGLTSRVDALTTVITNLDVLTSATEGRADDLGLAIVDVNATLKKVRDLLVRNSDQIKSLLSTITNVLETTDLAAIDKTLAEAPDMIEQLDRGLLVVRALLQKRIPAMGNLIIAQGDTATDAYDQAAQIAQTNPLLRNLLINILELYLGS